MTAVDSIALAGTASGATDPYDCLLLVGFGGPEGLDDVEPFLRRVASGRDIPPERLQAVAAHYYERDGVSPINQQHRDLVSALQGAFQKHDLDLPVYWGNRNWHPFLDCAISEMTRDRRRRALALVTSPYSSYSSCRQYRENLAAARLEVGPRAPLIEKLRVYFNHPGFVDPMAEATLDVLEKSDVALAHIKVLFSAHSLPIAMANACEYQAQLESVANLIRSHVVRSIGAFPASELVWQSRSGPPKVVWLEPDVTDVIGRTGRETKAIVVVPIGFVSDNMEVVHDLDDVARREAEVRGFGFHRVATVGTHPKFVDMIVELVRERLDGFPARAQGPLGVPAQCDPNCCLKCSKTLC